MTSISPQGRRALPGGPATRTRPAGIGAGARGSKIEGPTDALGLVADELGEVELALRELIQTDVAAVPAIAGYLADAGGKRLRPALTILAARCIDHRASVVRLACVGELLHLGSLLHDDVVDGGVLRRGQPAAHQLHGNAVAVLTGDFCLARAVGLAAEEGGYAAVRALGDTVTEMAEGEVLQLQRAGDLSCTTDQYLDVVARKSAALIAWCAAAPAWAADRGDHADALAAFGRGVGIAFQITDDVLDYAQGTGKAAGADLRERKVTLPLLFAMDRVDGLRQELETGPPTAEALPDLMDQVRSSGALDLAMTEARRRVDDAVGALWTLPDNPGRAALTVLAAYLVERGR